ncbi:MAG: hypothetical protein WBD36_10075 [Bacteroidota bacterium]
MKVLHPAFVTSILILVLSTVVLSQAKKYDMKSGIIRFETTTQMMGMEIKRKSVLYFDDYGMKECKETYEGDKLKESFFSDGKNLHTVIFDQKTVWKRGPAFHGTEYRFDWSEISGKDKKAGKAKQLGKVTVAGKECESYELTDRGTTTRFAGWGHLCLLTDLTTKDMHTVTKAVTLEETATVPAEKFAVPSGFKME